jgi:hypothetical protein
MGLIKVGAPLQSPLLQDTPINRFHVVLVFEYMVPRSLNTVGPQETGRVLLRSDITAVMLQLFQTRLVKK